MHFKIEKAAICLSSDLPSRSELCHFKIEEAAICLSSDLQRMERRETYGGGKPILKVALRTESMEYPPR